MVSQPDPKNPLIFAVDVFNRSWEQDGQQWAQKMKNLLETMNRKVIDAGGALDAQESQKYRLKYRIFIKQGEIECPEPIRPKKKAKGAGLKNQNPETCWNG